MGASGEGNSDLTSDDGGSSGGSVPSMALSGMQDRAGQEGVRGNEGEGDEEAAARAERQAVAELLAKLEGELRVATAEEVSEGGEGGG